MMYYQRINLSLHCNIDLYDSIYMDHDKCFNETLKFNKIKSRPLTACEPLCVKIGSN